MRHIMLIARRELGAYLNSYFGWVIVALALMANGLGFISFAMKGEKPSSDVVSTFLYFAYMITLVFGVLIAMRSFAAEREKGTLVLLQTSPASEWSMVLGKFLGSFGFLTVLIASTAYMPLMVLKHGNLEPGQILAGYLGLMLVGAVSTAIGVFGSVIAPNQILAAVMGAAIAFILAFAVLISAKADPPLDEILGFADLYYRHFHHIQDGSVYLRSLVYYPSLAFFFLLASVRVLESKRWR